MSRILNPGAQSKCKITGIPGHADKTVVLADSLKWKHAGIGRARADGAHTTKNLYITSFVPGDFSATFMTTLDMTFLQVIENAVFVFDHAQGYTLTFTGVTYMTEAVSEDTTAGKVDELTFGYEQVTQTNP